MEFILVEKLPHIERKWPHSIVFPNNMIVAKTISFIHI